MATLASVPIVVGTGYLYPALRKAGVTLGPGRTPSPAQFQDSIDELNRLLGNLHCDPMWIFSQDLQQFPLTAGKKTYTIGVDPRGGTPADFPIPAPYGINNANFVLGNPPLRYPLGIMTPQVWQSIILQDIPNTIPQGIYYDRAYPIGHISIFGQPVAGGALEFMAWNQIASVTSTTDVVVVPPGYEDAIVLNLALRMAPMFGRPVDPNVFQQARESMMRVLSMNAKAPVLRVDGLGCGCSSGGPSDPWRTTQWGPQG